MSLESPWQLADAGRPPSGSANIKREWIQEYFAAEQQADDDSPWPDRETSRQFVEGAGRRRHEPAGVDSIDGIRNRLPGCGLIPGGSGLSGAAR